jgi:hypothetical protein
MRRCKRQRQYPEFELTLRKFQATNKQTVSGTPPLYRINIAFLYIRKISTTESLQMTVPSLGPSSPPC